MADHTAKQTCTAGGAGACAWSWMTYSSQWRWLSGKARGWFSRRRRNSHKSSSKQGKGSRNSQARKAGYFLNIAELEVLLKWQHAPKTKGAKKADKLQQWMVIMPCVGQPPAYKRWTDEDEQRLVALQTTNIDISNTQYECEVALKKRELEAAADRFSPEERDELQKKWDALEPRMRRKQPHHYITYGEQAGV